MKKFSFLLIAAAALSLATWAAQTALPEDTAPGWLAQKQMQAREYLREAYTGKGALQQ